MQFLSLPIDRKVKILHQDGEFIMSIRYYSYKVNLYRLGPELFEVFINHKKATIERIQPLDRSHSRYRFYADQISLPVLK